MVRKLYGLLANPVAHSKSPVMQQAAFAALSYDAVYVPFDVQPEMFATAVAGLRAINVAGFNVSMPYKQRIMAYLDEVDEDAQTLQSVNTVVHQNGKWLGYSTDGLGFWRSLPAGKYSRVVILGAGGAARAIIATGLQQAGVSEITVFNRVSMNFTEHATDLRHLADIELQDLADESNLAKALQQADLLVNTTSVGMRDATSPLTREQMALLSDRATVVDIIYRDAPTTFLELAGQRPKQNGLPMLIAQGAASFEIWTGMQPNIAVMQRAVKKG